MCSLLSKWFVSNLFLHFGQKQVASWAVCIILVHTTIVVWLLRVNRKPLNNKTVSPHLINPGIVLLPELRLVPELVSSSSLSIHGKSQTAGELSPPRWPSLPPHLPTANWECSSCCWSGGWECGDGFPSACWAWACTPNRGHSSTVLHLSDLRAMFPKGLKSWSEAF